MRRAVQSYPCNLITAEDLTIERTLDQHAEWSLSDVGGQLGLSPERMQFIIMRRIAAKGDGLN